MIQGLPERLRNLRELRKMTRKTVCESIGISESVLCEYESGNRTPSIAVLLKLCDFYRCTPNDLLIKNEHKLVIDTAGLTVHQQDILNNLIQLITNTQ